MEISEAVINLLYQTLLTVLNKNQMGKISPSEFNMVLWEVLQKNYSELFSDLRKKRYQKSRFQDTANYGNEAGIIQQAQEYYIAEKSVSLNDGKGSMPKDLYLHNSVFDSGTEYERVDLLVFNKLQRIPKMSPSGCAPIYTYNDGILKVFPARDSVEVTYFRQQKKPKWTYRFLNGIETFDPDQPDFQDIDMHPLMLHQIFVDTTALCGLNLQEEMAVQYSTQMKQEVVANQQ